MNAHYCDMVSQLSLPKSVFLIFGFFFLLIPSSYCISVFSHKNKTLGNILETNTHAALLFSSYDAGSFIL